MNSELLKQLRMVFEAFNEIKLVYFFGSRANGAAGPLSDYDFAVYLDETDQEKLFELKLKLLKELSRILTTDSIDLIILNNAESPELKYNIIKNGQLLFEREPYRIILEPRILNEYFDFHYMLKKYHLTKA